MKTPKKADFAAARAWRQAHGLSVVQMAELSGYSVQSIYNFEIGRSSTPGRAITPWAWLRYRMVCAGVELGFKTGHDFQW